MLWNANYIGRMPCDEKLIWKNPESYKKKLQPINFKIYLLLLGQAYMYSEMFIWTTNSVIGTYDDDVIRTKEVIWSRNQDEIQCMATKRIQHSIQSFHCSRGEICKSLNLIAVYWILTQPVIYLCTPSWLLMALSRFRMALGLKALNHIQIET